MGDVLVVIGASQVKGTMNLYLRQLANAGIDVYARDISKMDVLLNFEFKIGFLRWAAQTFSHYQKLILTDAFDVTFYGYRGALMRKIPDKGVMWAAEKNCFPDKSMEERIHGSTPWKYANGGMLCGTPASIWNWCDRAKAHPAYSPHIFDQQFLNERLAEGSDLCRIDSKTELFCCLYGGYDELEFTNGMPRNSVTGTRPNFLHANGNWPSPVVSGHSVGYSFAGGN